MGEERGGWFQPFNDLAFRVNEDLTLPREGVLSGSLKIKCFASEAFLNEKCETIKGIRFQIKM